MITQGRMGRPFATHPEGAWRWTTIAWWWVFARENHISDSPTTPGGTDASGAPSAEHPTLRALAAQPEADYDAFVREHQRVILNYLWRMLGDEQSAYDLTQEVFLR